MWLQIAAKCASAMRMETVAPGSAVAPVQWLRERVEALCADGAHGVLYIFLRHPPDAALAEALRWVAADHRLEPGVVAAAAALSSRAHLELLRQAGVRSLYVTLRENTAGAHDARTGEPGSWKRALAVLALLPRVVQRVRVGAHFVLSQESVEELPRVLQLMRRLGGAELLLWDAGAGGADAGGVDAAGLEPAAALRALDFAVTTAQKLEVRIRSVGFERTRTVVSEPEDRPCVASGAVVELLKEGIPLPSARAGVLATDGASAPIAEAAPTGRAVVQLGFELAARGIPLLDLPACLGGPPPGASSESPSGDFPSTQPGNSFPGAGVATQSARKPTVSEREPSSPGVKVDACKQCPIDARCAGVPRPMMRISGLREEIRPPRHWLPMAEHPRVLLLCSVVSDTLYGATFFSLARWLAQLGAHVDVVDPWAIYTDIAPSFAEHQRVGRPEEASEVEKFISAGPVDRYELIITPDPKVTHPLVMNRRLRGDTRLAVTDFHMLGGMDDWVRDLCAPGQRPEEGGWWPSDEILLYSAFPGYAWLYTRYGVPMRQVVWQPYALDPKLFGVEGPATDGRAMISAGHHRRDLETLLSAAARLSAEVHPIDLFASSQAPQLPRHIRFPTVPPFVFCEAVGRSRFMVVPLVQDPYNAAGITAIVTAMMCGRPVVATNTAAARDYITEGVNGLLVTPGDPQALAEAITRLDTDPSLLAALAAGAGAAAQKLTTEAWARALLHGSRTYDADHWMWAKWRGAR